MNYHQDDERMTTAEFRTALARLGWTQEQAAREIGVSPRTARGYATNYPIPPSKAILLRLLVRAPNTK